MRTDVAGSSSGCRCGRRRPCCTAHTPVAACSTRCPVCDRDGRARAHGRSWSLAGRTASNTRPGSARAGRGQRGSRARRTATRRRPVSPVTYPRQGGLLPPLGSAGDALLVAVVALVVRVLGAARQTPAMERTVHVPGTRTVFRLDTMSNHHSGMIGGRSNVRAGINRSPVSPS